MNFLKKYQYSLAFTLLIIYLSLARPASIKDLNVVNLTDKTAHYLVYVFYGLIIIYEYLKYHVFNFSSLHFWLACIVSPIAFGGIIELVQEAFFKPRSAEWLDWFCDFAGIFTACFIMKLFYKHLPSAKNKL